MRMLLQCHMSDCDPGAVPVPQLCHQALKEYVRAAHLEGWLHAPGTCGKRVRGC